ncbi:MAG: cyclic pyranopterin phosphate synthase [Planctomycetota bacterium]|jgi:cyclic pyranopterin phosphate synthase
MSFQDKFGRPLQNLRLSVTDRCNLRCAYCMPEVDYTWLPRRDILDFEEISKLVDVFIGLGVNHVRLTGGEPLLRRDLPILVRDLADKAGILDLALTTNGVLLEKHAQALFDAGLHRITISLDTLRRDRFKALTRRDDLEAVLRGIDAARSAGFEGVKIDSVVMRGTNDDELVDLIEYGQRVGAEVRFIEYMDVGGATHWSLDKVVSRTSMLESVAERFGEVTAVDESNCAPADRFQLSDGTVFGVIASTTSPFCSTCNRSRMTADGMWYLCLYARDGFDLRKALRNGATTSELAAMISGTWKSRDDRGAEERLASDERQAIPSDELQRNPHLEMHKRGG